MSEDRYWVMEVGPDVFAINEAINTAERNGYTEYVDLKIFSVEAMGPQPCTQGILIMRKP